VAVTALTTVFTIAAERFAAIVKTVVSAVTATQSWTWRRPSRYGASA